MKGCGLSVEKQNAEMKKSQGKSSGKTSINSLGALKNLPGVKSTKKKR